MNARRKILLVDDSPVILRIAGAFLSREYEIETAGSGTQARELASKYPPDLIVMDLNMPGLNGIETALLLRGEQGLRDIPIIIMTTESELLRIPPDFQHVVKPFDGPVLLKTVATCLAAAAARRAAWARLRRVR